MTSILTYESWSEDDWVGLRSSDGKFCISQSPDDLLEFIRYSAKGVIRAVWDIDDFIAPVLRLLPRPILESLVRHDDNTQYGSHELYYLDGRSFRCGRTRFHGLKTFWSSSEPVPSTLEEVQLKADELSETLSDCGMGDFQTLVSPIAVFAETVLGKQTYESIPKGYEISPSCFQAIEYASKCDKREWISAYQVGGFGEGEIWDYDCNAMYPSCASELLNLHELEMWKSDTFHVRERGAYYGFMRGRLYLESHHPLIHCSPLITDLERLPGNPAGDFGEDYYLTLDELRFIQRYDLGVFQMTDGWFLKPYAGVRPGRPFQQIMDYLYSKRYKSELASSVMKGVANQLIGKLIETRVDGDYGKLRNDIYHAIILSQARVKVAEFLAQNDVKKDELVAIQTDGVRMLKSPIDIYNISIGRNNGGMGSWRCNGPLPTIVASPYKVYTHDKKPGHLTYDHIAELVKEHPQSRYYSRTVPFRVTLRQALQQGDISKVGVVDDLPAHLDLVQLEREQNRIFSRMPRTGQALLNGTYQSEAVIL